ncbi:hypothetical protein [Amaricoccus sp. W119]|uniref:hypothetical protein n=1 Tax=Amaricoccus sp. W119 TaxID=3391833 RepID=UPI0039A72011
MSYYDYKIVPAPKKAKKVKGVSSAAELFALTLTDAINEHARQGWEYYGSEELAIETPGGWFRRARTEEHTVLVFRRSREHLSPRVAGEMPREAPLAAPREAPREPRRETMRDAPREIPRELPRDVPRPRAVDEPILGPAPTAPRPPASGRFPTLGPAGRD